MLKSSFKIASIFLLIAYALRIYFLATLNNPLDSDECAEALMALDLVEEPQFIIGWLGQDYMGSLEIYLLSVVEQLFN